MESFLLDLPLKGNRTYVHGTDLFDALVTRTRPQPPLSLRIHRIIKGLVQVAPLPGQTNPAALFVSTIGENKPHVLGLYEQPRDSQPRRVAFDEEAIAAGHSFHDQSVDMVHRSDASLIERWIVLNKLLHQRLLPNDRGRWMFTRIDLSNLPVNVAQTDLRFKGRVGTRLTRVAIETDGSIVGDLYFSLVNS